MSKSSKVVNFNNGKPSPESTDNSLKKVTQKLPLNTGINPILKNSNKELVASSKQRKNLKHKGHLLIEPENEFGNIQD